MKQSEQRTKTIFKTAEQGEQSEQYLFGEP